MGTISFLGILEERHENILKTTADEIIKEASAHLEYVQHPFPEFTLHNKKHSENVLKVMEDLLGEDAKKLNSYELFSLIAVAYLHDCGMGVSDCEINVLIEAEKLDERQSIDYENANDIILKNIGTINPGGFNGEIQYWWFVPKKEQSLIDYYADMLEEYQGFRNKKVDKIIEAREASEPQKELDLVNIELRTEYLRRTHHSRIKKYILNLKEAKEFTGFSNWEPVAETLADICCAHGEDKEYIKQLRPLALGNNHINTQFVAMMLRIADITDFCSDRAPATLRALHIFQSEKSFKEWKKQERIDYTISTDNKQICYESYFKSPIYYYSFLDYIKDINEELKLYDELKHFWDNSYTTLCTCVNDKSVLYDKTKFLPAPELKCSLDKKKIIELLMGKKLYKNKYACLRELYQNSLDACRCSIAKGTLKKGKISFGLERDDDDRLYVYCLDNGTGMTRSIIQDYLLKIGNSYYKSQDFYSSQAATGYLFNPISQFGIGILSCFMIGYEIEIITKNEKEQECISIVMTFSDDIIYYKTANNRDKSLVSAPSGTLVKVFLNDEGLKLNSRVFDDLSFHIIRNRPYLQPNSEKEDPLWVNNLYHIMNDFIICIPENIEIFVKLGKNYKLQIFNKPLVIGKDKIFKIPKDEYETFAEAMKFVTGYKKPVILEIENTKNIILNKEVNGIQYKFCISFLKNSFKYKKEMDLSTIVLPIHRRNGFCIDGIRINVEPSLAQSFFRNMGEYGIVNFYGENQPTISVDRDTIIEDDLSKYDFIAKKILEGIIDEGITEIIHFIDDNNISENSLPYYYAWRSFIFRFIFCIDILLDRILRNESACIKLVTIKENEDKKKIQEKYEIDNNIGKIYPSILDWIKFFYDAKSEGKTQQRYIPLNGLDLGYYKTKNPSFYKALMYGLVFNKKDQDDFSISIADPITKKLQ